MFLSSRKCDPGCSSRVPDPDVGFLPIPDPGIKKAPYPGSGSATLLFIYFFSDNFSSTNYAKNGTEDGSKLIPFNFWYICKFILLQDDLLRLEAYKADLSHLNLSLSNLIAQLVGANSAATPLLITQNNASGRWKSLAVQWQLLCQSRCQSRIHIWTPGSGLFERKTVRFRLDLSTKIGWMRRS